MNYWFVLFLLPLIALFIWVEYIISRYERKIQNLKRLVYKLDNKVKKLENKKDN